MMRTLSVLVVVGFSSLAVAQPARPKLDTEKLEAARAERAQNHEKFLASLAWGNADSVAAMLATPFEIRGIWFPSETCQKSFGQRVTIPKGGDVKALAACLIELKLRQGSSESALRYLPGVSVSPLWRGPVVGALTGEEIDPTSPSIEREVLVKHARTKLAVKRDKATAAAMKQNKELVVVVDIRLCINAKGKVDALEVKADATFESYRAAVEKAAKKWTFKPFLHAAKPVRVCASYDIVEYDGDGMLGGVEGGAYSDVAPSPPPPVKN